MAKIWRIVSWNVNGIRAAAKKGFLEWLARESPEILCAQETKVVQKQLSGELMHLAGYDSHWHGALVKKGYSGVAVYTKEKPVNVETSMGVKRFDDEGRFLRLDFPSFTLLNVYFPNGKKNEERLQFKMDFYDTFLAYAEDLRKEIPGLIFVGDVNTAHQEIDLARPKENSTVSGFLPIEREWIDTVVSLGYVDTFRHFHPDEVQYSWWDLKSRARERNVGWRIDYVFVTRELLPAVKSAYILGEITGSDHCPVGIDVEAS
jgi:exodeoxyribonuclease-3